jgi:hypothetical protein
MRLLIKTWHRALTLFRRRRLEQDLDDEVRLHLEMREAEYARKGLPLPSASAAARRHFGSVAATKDQMRADSRIGRAERDRTDNKYKPGELHSQ